MPTDLKQRVLKYLNAYWDTNYEVLDHDDLYHLKKTIEEVEDTVWITDILEVHHFTALDNGAYKLKVDDDEVIRVYPIDWDCCFVEHYGEIYKFDCIALSKYLNEVL